MRTLLIDDCIDKGTEYHNGGARYKWSIVNFAGMINVIDSMLVIRDFVFEEKLCEPEDFIEALIMGYMKLGGIQFQITCTSIEKLKEAYENPHMHKNLIVRVGGYSEYFQNLTDELKKMIINRTIQNMK